MNLCDFEVGIDRPLFLIAGPDSLESPALVMDVAGHMAELCAELGIGYIFKGSFDKANRSSHTSYRGPGIEAGLDMLAAVKREIGVPVTTDVHVEDQIEQVAAVVVLAVAPSLTVQACHSYPAFMILRAAAPGMP